MRTSLLGIELTKQDQVNEVPFCIEKSLFFCRPKKVETFTEGGDENPLFFLLKIKFVSEFEKDKKKG